MHLAGGVARQVEQAAVEHEGRGLLQEDGVGLAEGEADGMVAVSVGVGDGLRLHAVLERQRDPVAVGGPEQQQVQAGQVHALDRVGALRSGPEPPQEVRPLQHHQVQVHPRLVERGDAVGLQVTALEVQVHAREGPLLVEPAFAEEFVERVGDPVRGGRLVGLAAGHPLDAAPQVPVGERLDLPAGGRRSRAGFRDDLRRQRRPARHVVLVEERGNIFPSFQFA